MKKSFVLLTLLAAGFAAQACMTFVVGKKVSATERVLVGHTNELFIAQKGHWGFKLVANGHGGHQAHEHGSIASA